MNGKLKIYLGACCWCRPFDDQVQSRVRLEAEAVLSILAHGRANNFILAASEATEFELSGITDADKLKKIYSLYSATSERLLYTEETRRRALLFQQQGIKLMDSLHLALAEEYRQDILLTTDDAFIATAKRSGVGVPVANPVAWLMKETL
jgi:predicted nucleic acid-binding protein